MKKVFICSPFVGNKDCPERISGHIEIARKLSRAVANDKIMPLAPHLLFPQFLDDNNPIERAVGCCYSLALLRECDAMLLYDKCCGLSEGMKAELKEAERLKLPIYESIAIGQSGFNLYLQEFLGMI